MSNGHPSTSPIKTPSKTPSKTRKYVSRSAANTPKSVAKKTILDFGANDSYIEDDDDTYLPEDTMVSTFSDGDISGEVEEDFLVIEETELDQGQTDSSVPQSNGSESSDKSTNEYGVVGSDSPKFLIKHEIPRKLFHSSIGLLTLWLYTLGVSQKQLLVPLGTLFVTIFTNDYIRLHNEEVNRRIVNFWWWVIRKEEINKYNGILYYLAGLFLVFTVAPKDISVLCVLFLSWADTSAATIGRQYGKYTPQLFPGKSLAGALASFATGAFSTWILYGYFIPAYTHKVDQPGDIFWSPDSSSLSFLLYAIIGGVVASTSECVSVLKLDDNFTIPVLSGILLYAITYYCHY
ncbi:Piso0_004983 [Millerozyma farinosa CBS 7064]|uniref:Piso0_004983 protein n=1 Tax=Pichia sorbitophila (strain ATCC MYA-4447 / BCRC 22081 / CBS 7064 / NBRC 10061 / NRRL Y-12695) TaxID=559304 RepID=G8Y0Y5_PICSO|nr:Piso0_004983 [Millerozyma farinosa CBS 7064]